MDRNMQEQHDMLKQLQTKLEEVLECEPLDSEDELENEIWKMANNLKDYLDDFFELG